MNEPIEITKGSTYIFVGKKAMTRNEYSKFKILEVTDTTYLIENIDADRTFRRGIVDFNYDYKPVEVIESYEQLLLHNVVKQSEQLFCDCYIKYPRGDGDCRRCGLPAKP